MSDAASVLEEGTGFYTPELLGLVDTLSRTGEFTRQELVSMVCVAGVRCQ